ncbi:MAG: hypothetical protein KDH48_07055, partial [Rhodoferax sp.]|nr:hypothetical protein [Rhodoferax sp.]
AKGVCSAAFVAHRPVEGLLAAEVLPASPVLGLIDVTVHPQDQRVQARFAGWFAREAQWLPSRGCVLDIATGPVRPAVRPQPDLGRPWPQGEAALAPDAWGAGVDRAALQRVVQQA